LTPNLTAFTDVDSQNLPDVMVSVQFILAIGDFFLLLKIPATKLEYVNVRFLLSLITFAFYNVLF
ncbi:hypothetical protein, partial [Lactobacillus delbrueckii]|uniref:hypothetical protein n=1 Tax=Lactobacillus delbrueckii TaxID=1584 RepID=UPI0021A39183